MHIFVINGWNSSIKRLNQPSTSHPQTISHYNWPKGVVPAFLFKVGGWTWLLVFLLEVESWLGLSLKIGDAGNQYGHISEESAVKLFPHLSVHGMHLLCLGSRLVCFAAKGAKTKHRQTECRAKSKHLQQRTFPTHVPLHSIVQRLETIWQVLGAKFFGTIGMMEFVLKKSCLQLCSFSVAPGQRSYACPMAEGLETLTSLGRTVFQNNRIGEICPEKPVPTTVHFSCLSLPTKLCVFHCQRLQTICKIWTRSFLGTEPTHIMKQPSKKGREVLHPTSLLLKKVWFFQMVFLGFQDPQGGPERPMDSPARCRRRGSGCHLGSVVRGMVRPKKWEAYLIWI